MLDRPDLESQTAKTFLVRKLSAPGSSTTPNTVSHSPTIPTTSTAQTAGVRRMSAIGVRRASSRHYPPTVYAYPLPRSCDSIDKKKRGSSYRIEIPAHMLLLDRNPSSISSASSMKKYLKQQQELLDEQQQTRGSIPFLPGFSLCGAILLAAAALALFVLLLTQSTTHETKLCGGDPNPPRVS
ncbi:unnamed protein product [Bursaphelenchus okinawaensis]|uniref:Uncharacterized protein n=1 Tax=Bursaphelenchus okinawaensis TaxID=465554 RepID=A0A811KC59_9BILA|nr:unnamed protein product [Bursaphelenchus okinawaensis]CAG9096268.1 unnamed protein product [Bursaphelenchus okinawaensis]